MAIANTPSSTLDSAKASNTSSKVKPNGPPRPSRSFDA
jgi:hypothetical protein